MDGWVAGSAGNIAISSFNWVEVEVEAEFGNIKEKESEILKLKHKVCPPLETEKTFNEKIDCLKKENNILENENKELKEENESLRNDLAVNDMLHESFKERMRDKYLYNTEDEDSEYESDDEIREKKR